jgi:hypothetical protein
MTIEDACLIVILTPLVYLASVYIPILTSVGFVFMFLSL